MDLSGPGVGVAGQVLDVLQRHVLGEQVGHHQDPELTYRLIGSRGIGTLLPEARRALAVLLTQGCQPVAYGLDFLESRLDLLRCGGTACRCRALRPRRLQRKGTNLQVDACWTPGKP